jgi:SAM-dependent methyltransferase
MAIWTGIGAQLRHPTGGAGWMAGQMMRVVNARPNVLAVAALGLRSTDRLVELGCGPGHAIRLAHLHAPRGTIDAVDRSDAMLAQATARNRAAIEAGRVRLHRGTFERLPFPDGAFDKALAVNVAYFWDDGDAVLGEVRRVLRPGGVLAIYVTDAATMRRWRFAGPETHRHFDRDDLAAMLRQGGFREDGMRVIGIRVAWRIDGLCATAVA